MDFITARFVKFSIFILLTLNFGLSALDFKHKDKLLYANQIINEFSKEVESDFGLVCIGDGGQMPNDIERLFITFVSYKELNINQARNLELKLIDNLVNKINNNENIKPYLRKYPCNADGVKVSICFYDKNNNFQTHGFVADVVNIKGKLYYSSYDSNTQRLNDLYEESYDEARKIVQKNL